jgi:hypothetical protein
VNSSEVPLLISRVLEKVVVEHITLHCKLFGARSKNFHELSEVIIVLFKRITGPWVEEKVTRDQLKDHTGKGPEISRGIIVNAQYNLRSSILPSLDLGHKVIVRPTPVSKVTNFAVNFLID